MIYKTIINETKELKQIYANPGNGYFAIDEKHPKALNWHNCREKFLACFFSNSKGFFFSHINNNNEDIAGFIIKCEKIIQNSDNRIFENTYFKKTCDEKIIWIQPSCFWLDCIIKRSLLTLLLRCSLNYKISEDNFDNCFFSEEFKENKLARDTKNAIIRFFHGFTEFTGSQLISPDTDNQSIIKQGWHFEFTERPLLYLKQKLQKPFNKKSKNIFGIDTLWN